MEEKKRLGIFVFYDKDGIVDDYVIYLLKDLKENLARLVILCNGELTSAGRRQFMELTPDVYVRENEGFDAGAYRYALTEYLGWETVREYDELVLCNDTFYGPFWPFSGYFSEMDTEHPDADFWGMTVHGQADDLWNDRRTGCIPEHIQSYFLVMRRNLLHSREFSNFWDELETNSEDVLDIIENFEICFTRYFSERGFTWAVCADTRCRDNKDHTHILNPNVFECDVLIRDFHCPLIKRRAFSFPEHIECNDGGEVVKALNYIRENSDYDISMIYRHLLRVINLTALKQNLDWNYILPTDRTAEETTIEPGKALIVIHQYYPELVEEIGRYVREIPQGVDLLITTGNPDPEMKEKIEKLYSGCRCRFLGVIDAPKRGRDMAGFLCAARETMKDYEYVCFTHDKKTNAQAYYVTIGEAFRHLILENVLASEDYIRNILHTFEENPDLGVLAPPVPYFGSYLNAVARGWTDNFDSCREVLKLLGLKVPLDEKAFPYVVGTSLWFRTEALKPLLDHPFTPEFFPAEPMPVDGSVSHGMERAFPYIAQSRGYYSGWVMTPRYASLYLEQFYDMFSAVSSECVQYCNDSRPIAGFRHLESLMLQRIKEDKADGLPLTHPARQSMTAETAPQPTEIANCAVFGNRPEIVRAAYVAGSHDRSLVSGVSKRDARKLFWILWDVFIRKYSIHPVLREQARYIAALPIPGVRDAIWLLKSISHER